MITHIQISSYASFKKVIIRLKRRELNTLEKNLIFINDLCLALVITFSTFLLVMQNLGFCEFYYFTNPNFK